MWNQSNSNVKFKSNKIENRSSLRKKFVTRKTKQKMFYKNTQV